MVEVQSHGFSFERWVRNTLFEGYTGNYMQKWDVPPICNQHEAIPTDCRDLPVSIKSAKYGSAIGLGDIIRQRSVAEPFLMIVGFWRQRTPTEKWFEDIGWAKFTPTHWASLWGTLSSGDVLVIDAIVKDLSSHFSLVRKGAQAWKKNTAAGSGNRIVINPKIDSKGQRRVQCSLPFGAFWEAAGRLPQISDAPSLFGFEFENPVPSAARTFSRGQVQDPPEVG